MISPAPEIFICGVNELGRFADMKIDYLVSLNDPEAPTPTPPWIKPSHHISIDFYDAEEDVPGYPCPERHEIEALLRWFAELTLKDPNARVLVQCRQGRSRSSALAYAFLALLNPEADPNSLLGQLLVVRPNAFPNQRIVDLADDLMKRGGSLSDTVRAYKSKRTQEILALQRQKA
jgi:predicted protein tyrosine phosphatase